MGIEMPVPAKPEGVDAEVWEQMLHATPAEARHLIREGKFAAPTSGLCPGYAQANLIILPREQAYDFLLFAQRNPKPCPILEVTEVGERMTHICAKDCDVATDFPGYRIYKDGVMVDEVDDVVDYWRDDLVSFLIGCSFTFEHPLAAAGVPLRHAEANRNVPMYVTSTRCRPAGRFSGPLVVSMRPIPANRVADAVRITSGTRPCMAPPSTSATPPLSASAGLRNPTMATRPSSSPATFRSSGRVGSPPKPWSWRRALSSPSPMRPVSCSSPMPGTTSTRSPDQ